MPDRSARVHRIACLVKYRGEVSRPKHSCLRRLAGLITSQCLSICYVNMNGIRGCGLPGTTSIDFVVSVTLLKCVSSLMLAFRSTRQRANGRGMQHHASHQHHLHHNLSFKCSSLLLPRRCIVGAPPQSRSYLIVNNEVRVFVRSMVPSRHQFAQ